VILVTGFEPFAGASINPSGEIAKQLNIDGVLTAVLPVTYEGATKALLDLVAEHKPKAVVCLGLAEGRTTISFEQVAINLDDAALADNSGDARRGQPISKGGETAYFTTLPIRELVDALKAESIAAAVSLSAGAFVCNHIFYELQKFLVGTSITSGFVHLPLLETMPLETQSRGVELMINQLKGTLHV
jgi:pyroglutamyl-peptidase